MLSKTIFYKTFSFIFILWILFLLQSIGFIDSKAFSLFQDNGVKSIFTGMFLHGDINHLVGNTKGLLICLPLLFYLHRKRSFEIILIGYFFPAIICYNLGLNVLGISGLVYTLLWFLIFSGLGSKDKERFIVSIILIFTYSTSLMGITPELGIRVCWQAHLAGFFVGSLYAFKKFFNKK